MIFTHIISALAIVSSVAAVEERCVPKDCKGIKCLKNLESIPKIELIESSKKFVYRIDLIPEIQNSLQSELVEVANNFGGNVFVLRKDLIRDVRAGASKSVKVLLDGPVESESSALLLQMYASVKESIASDPYKLILYAPNAHSWSTGQYPFNPVMIDGKIKYEQPELAMEILHLFLIDNAEKMPKGFAEKYELAKLDVKNRAMPLYHQFLKDLPDSEFFLFFDGMDDLLYPKSLTGYTDPNGNPLPLKDFILSERIFKRFNGTIIGTLNEDYSNVENIDKTKFSVVNVPKYSCRDVKRVLEAWPLLCR